MVIRTEAPADEAGIYSVIAAAFGRLDEADLVAKLRASGTSIISLVALDEDAIIGHVLFSRMTAPFLALGLGPVSVLPRRQRAGIGSRLIRAGLQRAKKTGWQGVFVVGDPAYYERFGFDASLAVGFTCRHSGPNFMALALGPVLPATEGAIDYPAAFSFPG